MLSVVIAYELVRRYGIVAEQRRVEPRARRSRRAAGLRPAGPAEVTA